MGTDADACLRSQPELSQVLYPLFVHAYLELVQRGASGLATDLMAAHRPRFVAQAGTLAAMRQQVRGFLTWGGTTVDSVECCDVLGRHVHHICGCKLPPKRREAGASSICTGEC